MTTTPQSLPAQNIQLSQILESAVVVNWSDLVQVATGGLLQVEYHIGGERSVDSLKMWCNTTRGYWSLICDYSVNPGLVEWSTLQQRLSFPRSRAVVGVDHAESEPVPARLRDQQQRRDPDRSPDAGSNRRRQAANGRSLSRACRHLAQTFAPHQDSASRRGARLNARAVTKPSSQPAPYPPRRCWKRETRCASILSLFGFTMRRPAWCPAFLPHRQPRGCASTIVCYWGAMPLSARWSGALEGVHR